MKKLFSLIVLSLFCQNSFAATISLNTISADSTVSTFNSNFTTLSNVINGNIEGSSDGGSSVANIKADSVYEINMANDANPRVRESELLGIGVDSTASGALVQTTYVASGGVPADDTDLTSDISAIVAYINGYRVSKGATSLTYTASMDNYVDISQTGVYTVSPVAVGATQPSVAANSARLAKVTTDGTEITVITDLARRTLSGLVVPTNFRAGLEVSRVSTTVIQVNPGTLEVDGSMLAVSAPTTLDISVAGDYAGGSSLRATNTTLFVGITSGGSIDFHTTAPTHTNYDLTLTSGTLRYASWSGTTYRIIGWVRLSGASPGTVQPSDASNILEMGVRNFTFSSDATVRTGTGVTPKDNTIPQQNTTEANIFYTNGIRPTHPSNKLVISGVANAANSAGGQITVAIFNDATADAVQVTPMRVDSSDQITSVPFHFITRAGTTSYTVYKVSVAGSGASTTTLNGESAAALYGGRSLSSISITEESSQLTS